MGRGGSRNGAGRPGWRAKAEHCLSIDVRAWARRGYLRPGQAFGWHWHRDGEPAASIGVKVHADSVLLRYATNRGAEREYPVSLLRTPCHYGGTRTWFACPCCGGRAAKLYLRGARFVCRHCGRLAYVSQGLDSVGRAWRAQAKIEAKLIDGWRRPKGMHKATVKRLRRRIRDVEARRDEMLLPALARLMERAGVEF